MFAKHNKYDGIDMKESDNDRDHDLPFDLQCCICNKLLTNPVKNASANTYCYNCIVQHYRVSIEILIQEQDNDNFKKSIRDPNKNKPLPQHSLLLIPDFKKLIKIYEYQTGLSMTDMERRQFMKIDDDLNHYRKKSIQPPLNSKIQQKICKIATNDGIFTHHDLSQIVDGIWKLYHLENKIHHLIECKVTEWNKSFGYLLSYQWIKPNFKTALISDKNAANDAIENFGIDQQCEGDLYGLEIEQFVVNILEILSMERNEKIAKEDIIQKIMIKQQEIIDRYTGNDHEEKQRMQQQDIQTVVDKNIVRLDTDHRLWYTENMKCSRDMMEMVNKEEPFELIFENNAGYETSHKLLRFLQFCGFQDAAWIYKIINNKLVEKLRYEILKRSADNNRSTKYWMSLLDINIIENPIEDNLEHDNFIWFNVTLDLDFYAEIRKFDDNTGYKNAEYRFKKVMKKQLMKHLDIPCSHYVTIYEIQPENMQLIVGIAFDFIMISLANTWCYSIEVTGDLDNTWKRSRYSAISRCIASAAALGLYGVDKRKGHDAAHIGSIVGGIIGGILGGIMFKQKNSGLLRIDNMQRKHEWNATFVMITSRCIDAMNNLLDDVQTGIAKSEERNGMKLNCDHKIGLKRVETGVNYKIVCNSCGEECYVQGTIPKASSSVRFVVIFDQK